jgi:hypothetical protein
VSPPAAGKADRKSLKDRVSTAAVLVAAAGAVWYAAMSVLTARVYEPAGVTPRDLGLSSSTILMQVTVGLAVSVVVGVVTGGIVGGLLGAWSAGRDPELRERLKNMPLPFVSDDPVSNAAAAVHLQQEAGLSQEEAEHFVQAMYEYVRSQSVEDLRSVVSADLPDDELAEIVEALGRDLPRATLRAQAVLSVALMSAVGGVVVALVVGLIGVGVVASNSRDDIEAGRAPGFVLGLPPPWGATIADVKPAPGTARGATDAMPSCALFLGQNGSTIFLRQPNGPTIRVPASAVRLDLTDRRRCPQQ